MERRTLDRGNQARGGRMNEQKTDRYFGTLTHIAGPIYEVDPGSVILTLVIESLQRKEREASKSSASTSAASRKRARGLSKELSRKRLCCFAGRAGEECAIAISVLVMPQCLVPGSEL